ncbi:hypothetical protein [Duganella sp. P38]|uniref:hypothetical protein n=1 Tax=Duganella sp. P38 TaxID=3423949 RepID=UPI003D78C42C
MLEFVVCFTVVAILGGLLLQRLWHYRAEAERAAVQMVIANIRSALEIKVAQANLPDGSLDFTFLTEENPLNLLKVKPVNYAGEWYRPSGADIGAGNWCFDRADKTLLYLLNNVNSFEDSQTKLLKFKVKLTRLPHSPAKPSGAPETLGVAFEQVKD